MRPSALRDVVRPDVATKMKALHVATTTAAMDPFVVSLCTRRSNISYEAVDNMDDARDAPVIKLSAELFVLCPNTNAQTR